MSPLGDLYFFCAKIEIKYIGATRVIDGFFIADFGIIIIGGYSDFLILLKGLGE